MSELTAVVFLVAAAGAIVAAALRSPISVGRGIAAAGVLAAPWMDVRLRPWLTLSDALLVSAIPFLALGAPAGWVGRYLRGPHRWMLEFGALVLVGGLVATVLGRTTDAGGTAIGMRFGVSLLVMTCCVFLLVDSERTWRWVAKFYVVGGMTSGFVALARPGEFGLGRAIGLTSHPNHLGFSMLLAFALAMAVVGSSRPSERLVGVVGVPVTIFALLSSGSRAAFLGLLVFVIVLVAVRRSVRVPILVTGALLGALAVMVLRGLVGPGSSALNRTVSPSASEIRSSQARAEHLYDALERIRESPILGYGFEDALTFHSAPLQVVVVAGLLGMVAVVVAGRAAVDAVRAANSRGASNACRVSAAAMVGAMVTMVFSNQLFDRYVILASALFTSMALSGRSLPLRRRRAPGRSFRPPHGSTQRV